MGRKTSTEPIVLTGRVWTINALADLYPSRELKRIADARSGDIKLWSQKSMAKHAPVGSGQFRAAVFDGKKWRTFRLNSVTDDYSFYSSFDDRDRKSGRAIDGLVALKGQTAYYRQGSYGITFSFKGETVLRPAARTSTQPATGTAPKSTTTKEKPAPPRYEQLKLF